MSDEFLALIYADDDGKSVFEEFALEDRAAAVIKSEGLPAAAGALVFRVSGGTFEQVKTGTLPIKAKTELEYMPRSYSADLQSHADFGQAF